MGLTNRLSDPLLFLLCTLYFLDICPAAWKESAQLCASHVWTRKKKGIRAQLAAKQHNMQIIGQTPTILNGTINAYFK